MLGSPALRRPGRGAEPGALREAAGLAGSGASLQPRLRRGRAAAGWNWSRPRAPPPTPAPPRPASRGDPVPTSAAPGLSLLRAAWKGDPTVSAPGSCRGGCPGVGYVPKLLASAGKEGSQDNTAQTSLCCSVGRKHPGLWLTESRREDLGRPEGTGPSLRMRALSEFLGALEVP